MKSPILISDEQDLINNLEKIESYLDLDSSEENFIEMVEYIKRGHHFVCYNVGNEYHFVPSRFVGYKDNTLSKHRKYKSNRMITGTDTDKRLSKKSLLGNAEENDDIDKHYLKFCASLGITPSEKRQRKYWLFNKYISSFVENAGPYEEGKQKLRYHIQRERNRKAREKCIEIKGLKCCICGINFENVYGKVGKGFIQVHHITPISEKSKCYVVDPINDLVPVCPNCHAMLHKSENGKFLSVEELKQIVNK